MAIKNMIFDMGNVLLKFDPERYVGMLGVSKEDAEKLLHSVYCRKECAYLDRGDLTEEEFVDICVKDLGEQYRQYVNQLIFHWADEIREIVGMKELIKELKDKGYKIYLLSNAGYRQHEYWLKTPGHEYFDGTIVSCDVKHVKPEKEIYESLYKTFNIKPEESYFVDDLIINIYGARETGMDGFVFYGDVDMLRKDLKNKGIL